MLTDFDRLSLKEEVKRVKGVDVSKHAFTNLRPNDLTCEINVYDTETKELLVLKGKFRLLGADQLSFFLFVEGWANFEIEALDFCQFCRVFFYQE